MFSYAECALMADAVYHVKEEPNSSSIGELKRAGCALTTIFENAGPLYRAAIWQRGTARAFVVRGTVPSLVHRQNLGQDFLMKMASQAPYDLVKLAVHDIQRTIGPPHAIGMFVGHSLGGSAAQVLGLLFGLPFMTFNAPGMRYDLMRKGWVRQTQLAEDMVSPQIAIMKSLATMVSGGRDLADAFVKHTPGLDQSYDQARSEMARGVGIPVPDSTAVPSPDSQLGFNVAHEKDEIHNWLGPPIGTPYRLASWPGSPLMTAAPLISPEAGAAAGAYGIYYYHDSKKLAEYLRTLPWGGIQPVRATMGAKARVFYYRVHG